MTAKHQPSLLVDRHHRSFSLATVAQLPARTSAGTRRKIVHAEIGSARRLAHHLAGTVIGVALITILVLAAPNNALFPLTQSRWNVPCAIVTGAVIWWAVARVFGHRSRVSRAADALRSECICPACAYDLRGVPEAVNGNTVCPECGAAWTLPTTRNPSTRKQKE